MDSSADGDSEPTSEEPADSNVADSAETAEPTVEDSKDGNSGDDSKDGNSGDDSKDGDSDNGDDELAELREAVEEKYDFDNFGPAEMAKMSGEEWEAAFDAETWITGARLLDRVEADLKSKIAAREIFAVVEREPDQLVVYSDTGYAVVSADGTVEGEGGVRRDVEPVVAMCSMDDYEVGEPPADYELPSADSVPEQTGEFGNLMIQLIAWGSATWRTCVGRGVYATVAAGRYHRRTGCRRAVHHRWDQPVCSRCQRAALRSVSRRAVSQPAACSRSRRDRSPGDRG